MTCWTAAGTNIHYTPKYCEPDIQRTLFLLFIFFLKKNAQAISNMALSSMAMTFSELEPLPNFVEVPSGFLCEACKEVLRSPVQTLCGHHLCYPCVQGMLARAGQGEEVKCPGGEMDCVLITQDTVFPDICAKRELEKLKAHCKYKNFGCRTVVQWKDLTKHEETCPFVAVTCPNEGCDVMVAKGDLQNHVDRECLYTLVLCPSCGRQVRQGFREQHLQEECPAVSVPCPFKCGEQAIVRSQLDDHMKQCRSKPVDCVYRTFGCDFQGNKREIEKHMETGTQHHLELVTARAAELDANVAQLQNTMQQSTNENEMLKNQLTKQSEELTNQGRTIQNQSKKILSLEKTVAGKIQTVIELKDEVQALTTKCERSAQEQTQQQRHLQEMQQRHDRRLGDLERGALVEGGEGSESVRQQLVRHDRQLGVYDLRMSEMDLRFQCIETANYDGILLWKICDVSRRKREAANGRTLSLYSQPFYTNRYGYRMCARVYLNGDGLGKGTHMSLFFVVMKGDYDALLQWPFKQKVTMSLLDQSGGGRHLTDTFLPDSTSSSFQKPMSEMNVASGCPLFVAQSLAESRPYMVNDTIFIKVVVDTRTGTPSAA